MHLKKPNLTYSICDLFGWFNIITRDQLVISIKKFNAKLFEGMLSQKEMLDTRKTYSRKPLDEFESIKEVWLPTFMGIVVSLLNKSKFFSLQLIEMAY